MRHVVETASRRGRLFFGCSLKERIGALCCLQVFVVWLSLPLLVGILERPDEWKEALLVVLVFQGLMGIVMLMMWFISRYAVLWTRQEIRYRTPFRTIVIPRFEFRSSERDGRFLHVKKSNSEVVKICGLPSRLEILQTILGRWNADEEE